MKKLVCLFLCIAFCVCFASCSAEPEEVVLGKDNLSEYVSIELTFGEVDVADNESPTHDGKYYLTCLATITIKPKGDYTFTDASVSCILNEGGRWTPMKTSGSLTGSDLLYEWDGSLQLDKEGYGETTVSLFCYSDTYDRMHPSSVEWECYAISATGTATRN